MNGARTFGSAAAAAALAAATAVAQPTSAPPGAISGSATLGVRSVEVTGTEAKYREDLNLDDGVRLFGVHLSYAPSVGDTPVDRIELDADHLGGDPFESISLDVRKFGAYRLRLDRRRSEYFYEDTILPAAVASVSGSTAGDFHTFDFERIRSTASLQADVTPATQVSVGLERQTRAGDSTTTVSLERDEFALEQPLDESLNALNVGIRHAWRRVTLVVDEQVRDFENTSELFLPGASPGRNGADAAELQFFRFDRRYDHASRSHLLRVMAEPSARLDVAAGWRLEDLALDLRGAELARGTSAGAMPYETSRSGLGTIDRVIEIVDITAGFAATERIRLVGAVRRSTLEQSGAQTNGTSAGASEWYVASDGYELGAELVLSPAIVVSAGWSGEARTTVYGSSHDAAAAGENVGTDRAGYFARLAVDLAGGLEIDASLENNSIDDPFTLASPTSSRRYRVTARRRLGNGFSISGSYRDADVENDQSNWLADTEQAAVRLAYQRPRLQLSAGYTHVDVARSVEQAVAAGARITIFAIDYAAASTFRDTSAQWRLNDRWSIGGELRRYDNHGSFTLARDDWRVIFGVRVSGDYTLQAAYRNLDYVEDAYDSYDAGILEVSFGLTW